MDGIGASAKRLAFLSVNDERYKIEGQGIRNYAAYTNNSNEIVGRRIQAKSGRMERSYSVAFFYTIEYIFIGYKASRGNAAFRNIYFERDKCMNTTPHITEEYNG